MADNPLQELATIQNYRPEHSVLPKTVAYTGYFILPCKQHLYVFQEAAEQVINHVKKRDNAR